MAAIIKPINVQEFLWPLAA